MWRWLVINRKTNGLDNILLTISKVDDVYFDNCRDGSVVNWLMQQKNEKNSVGKISIGEGSLES